MVAAALGMALVWMGTRAGVGTFGDSVTYYTAARSLAAGQGLQQLSSDGAPMPLLQFPPGYPALLAGVGQAAGGALGAARAINIVAMGVAVLLLGQIVYRMTRSAVAAWTAAVLFAVHGQPVGLYLGMFSEPTYVALLLAVLATLMRFGPRGKWLWVAGCLAGSAILVRFAGVHLIGCCAVWIVAMNWRFGRRKALRRAAAFLIPALLPAMLWSIRNVMQAGHSTSRSLEYHRPTWVQVKPVFSAMVRWVIPIEGPWQMPALFVVLALWVIVPLWTIRKYGLPRAGAAARLALPALFVLTYVPFLWLARTFLDSAIPFNYRLLIPNHPVSLLVVAIWAVGRWRVSAYRPAVIGRVAAGVVGVVLAAGAVQQAHASLQYTRKVGVAGLGYGEKKWADSAGMKAIRELPPDAIVYTNAADAVYLLTGRAARTLPHSFGYGRTRGKALVEHGLVRLYLSMSREHAVAVYFTAIKRNTILVSEKQLVARVHGTAVKQLEDARIYSIPVVND